jgi:hypothetical protein
MAQTKEVEGAISRLQWPIAIFEDALQVAHRKALECRLGDLGRLRAIYAQTPSQNNRQPSVRSEEAPRPLSFRRASLRLMHTLRVFSKAPSTVNRELPVPCGCRVD